MEEFLSKLIVQVKNDSLTLNMKKNITNLFLMNELENGKEGKKSDISNIDTNDMIKYCIMGWYVYNSIDSNFKNEQIQDFKD